LRRTTLRTAGRALLHKGGASSMYPGTAHGSQSSACDGSCPMILSCHSCGCSQRSLSLALGHGVVFASKSDGIGPSWDLVSRIGRNLNPVEPAEWRTVYPHANSG
jgi:hypothetical protein